MTEKIVYIDMDDTLFDFTGARKRALDKCPAQPFPQSQIGFFVNLEPLPGAIWAVNYLKSRGFRVLFLTAPSVMNPLCYTEKRLSIEKHFGFEACHDLIIAHDKSLLLGDVLIDDRIDSNRQSLFKGRVLHFRSKYWPNWPSAVRGVLRIFEMDMFIDAEIPEGLNDIWLD